MRKKISRILRLKVVAGLGMALAVLPVAAAAQGMSTWTALNVATSDQGGRTQADLMVSVTGADGQPASGIVAIQDGSRMRAEAVLDGSGVARSTVTLSGGEHQLRAVYLGDAAHAGSTSPASEVQAAASTDPGFDVSIAPVSPTTFPMTLTAGDTGTALVTVTPQNNSTLTAPMFVTVACSGLPNQSSCTFTPETVEILANTPATCPSGSPASACPPTSSMLLQTEAKSGSVATGTSVRQGSNTRPVAWAILLPGVLGLGGLVFSVRRKPWLNRLALVALMGVVMTLGMAGCSPLYRYYNHGPQPNPATPSGTYTITITAQATNGVTATLSSTTMVLTVK